MMTDERCHRLDAFAAFRLRQSGALDHDHRDSKSAGSGDLAIGSGTTGVLGNDDLDGVLLKQSTLVSLSEGTTRRDVVGMWNAKRRLDRIDTADEIAMLRGSLQRGEFVSPQRHENPARRGSERLDRFGHASHGLPDVTALMLPGGAAQRDQWNARKGRGTRGIVRNAGRIGMRRIDQQAEAFIAQIGGQTIGPAEAPNPCRHGLSHRFLRASCERKQADRAIGSQPAGKLPRFRGATENKNGGFHAVS